MGFAPRDFDETADESIRVPLREGLEALRDTGVQLGEAEIPQDLPYWETLMQIMDGDAASILGPLIDSDRLALVTTEEQREGLRRLLATPARDYLDAQRVRARIQAQLREVFRSVDVLVSYTLAVDATAVPLDRPGESVMRTAGNAALLGAGNLAGLPGVFIPCGLGSAGLPAGLQLVGPPHSDGTLLRLAEWFQASSSWHTLRPPTRTRGRLTLGIRAESAASRSQNGRMDHQLAFATIDEIATGYRAGAYSATEATSYFLERLSGRGVELNAIASLLDDRATVRARELDVETSSHAGDATLWGIPYGVKDMFSTVGAPR